MNGIVFKIRDGGKVINKTVYLCVGLTTSRHKKLRVGHSCKHDGSQLAPYLKTESGFNP